MGRVDVEKAATVRAQVFDDFHRGHRPLGNCLCLPIEGMHDRVGIEILDHPLRDEDQGKHNTNGQQDVEGTADKIHPEVAQVLGAATRKATRQGHRQSDAGSSGDKLVKGQARHLGQVAHGLLARVELPVCVGGETSSGIESEARLNPG